MLGLLGLTRAAHASLAAQLPGAIATLNALPGAPVQLAEPGVYHRHGEPTGLRPDLATVGVTVEVAAPDLSLDSMDTGYRQADATGVVAVTVWAEDVDFQVLMDRLELYAQAVISVLAREGSCGAGTIPMRCSVAVRAADPDPETNTDRPIQAGASIIVQVGYDEALEL